MRKLLLPLGGRSASDFDTPRIDLWRILQLGKSSKELRHENRASDDCVHWCLARLLDEPGISEITATRPQQAAFVSVLSIATGAALPLAVTAFAAVAHALPVAGGSALMALFGLGAVATKADGASVLPGCWFLFHAAA